MCANTGDVAACRLQPAVAVTQEDEEALDVARTLLQAFSSGRQPGVDLTSLRQLFSELAPLVPELLPGFAHTSMPQCRCSCRHDLQHMLAMSSRWHA